MTRASFTTELHGRILVLIDLDEPGKMSVTNDARAVVEHCYKVFPGQFDRIIYRDSMGIFDELKTFQNRFDGFKPILPGRRPRTVEDAIKAVEEGAT